MRDEISGAQHLQLHASLLRSHPATLTHTLCLHRAHHLHHVRSKRRQRSKEIEAVRAVKIPVLPRRTLPPHCLPPLSARSSCRASEPTTSGFIGFGAVAAAASFGAAVVPPARTAPATACVPFYDGDDADISMAMRMLAKRDATTKLKALASLKALILGRPPAVVKQWLPSWGTAFKALCTHNDRHIRAAGLSLHREIVRDATTFVAHCAPLAHMARADDA